MGMEVSRLSQTLSILIVVMLVVGLAFVQGYCVGKRNQSSPHESIVVRSDTLWVTDTVHIDRPVEVTHWKDKLVYVPVTDTIVVSDTTYIALPFEKVNYSGENYEATVSGFRPKLESITVFPKTAYVTTREVEIQKWSIGVTFGPGIVYNGSVHGGIAVVAGVHYSF